MKVIVCIVSQLCNFFEKRLNFRAIILAKKNSHFNDLCRFTIPVVLRREHRSSLAPSSASGLVVSQDTW